MSLTLLDCAGSTFYVSDRCWTDKLIVITRVSWERNFVYVQQYTTQAIAIRTLM